MNTQKTLILLLILLISVPLLSGDDGELPAKVQDLVDEGAVIEEEISKGNESRSRYSRLGDIYYKIAHYHRQEGDWISASEFYGRAKEAYEKAQKASDRKVIIVAQDGSGDTKSIQEAVDRAYPGTLILIKPGSYGERVMIREKKDLELRGEFPDTKILLARDEIIFYVIDSKKIKVEGLYFNHQLEGLGCANAVSSVYNSSSVQFRSCAFNGCGSIGSILEESESVSFRSCLFFDNSLAGILLENYDSEVAENKNITIEDCFFYRTPVGLDCNDGENVRIRHNLILVSVNPTSPVQVGIRSKFPFSGVVENNIIGGYNYRSMNVQENYGVEADPVTFQKVLLRNNLFYNFSQPLVSRQPDEDDVRMEPVSFDSGNTAGDPLFMSLDTFNLNLQDNSPALKAVQDGSPLGPRDYEIFRAFNK